MKGRKRKVANRKILTEQNVLTLPLKKTQYQVWDGGQGRGSDPVARGLSVLVSPAGAKSYRATYYFPNSSKPHSITLGRVGEMPLEQARRLCREARNDARKGLDPKGDKSGSDAYAEVVRDYIRREQIGTRGNVSHAAVQRILLKYCEPWHMRSVATIHPPEIQNLLELIRDGDKEKGRKPAPYLANSVYARLRTFFAWCAKPTIGKVKSSPMIDIDKPWHGEKARDRVWFKGAAADQTIQKLWQIADTELTKTEGAYLKLMILTGKRKTALANMRWEELDHNWFWDPPQVNKKNKRLHGVPLPALAQRQLHPRKQRGFVFPGKGDKPLVFDGTKIARASGMEDFFLHGVRHLAETKMAELKVAPHIRDMLFDHVPARGSGKGYDHHHYKDEMLAALEQWAGYVEGLVTPKGVQILR